MVMELKEFKKWLIENEFEKNDLFLESIKCYQIESYKAAFLYSYLGFIECIRKNIIGYKGIPKSVKSDKKIRIKVNQNYKKYGRKE